MTVAEEAARFYASIFPDSRVAHGGEALSEENEVDDLHRVGQAARRFAEHETRFCRSKPRVIR